MCKKLDSCKKLLRSAVSRNLGKLPRQPGCSDVCLPQLEFATILQHSFFEGRRGFVNFNDEDIFCQFEVLKNTIVSTRCSFITLFVNKL